MLFYLLFPSVERPHPARMNASARAALALLLTILVLPALEFDALVAGNLSATNATFSFRALDGAKAEVPVTAVLRWGTTPAYGSEHREQLAGGTKPDQPIAGFRIMYLDDLQPATTYHWRLAIAAADGTTAEEGGTFTTLPVDTTKKRGPDGTHVPPHTPPYTTPATHVAASWDAVNGLLKTCQGGEVIEVAQEDSSGEKTIVLTGGSAAWEMNVLIRPPLGKRAANRSRPVEINSPRLTVAGFNLNGATMYPVYGSAHPGNAAKIGAQRAFFWMCTIGRQGSLLANGCPDSGWYEVVALRRGVGGDRAQIKTYAKIAPQNFTVAGCWLEGKDRTNFKDHSDTLQTLGFGQPLAGLRLIDTVFFRSANCSGQLTDLADVLIQNCWFGPLVQRSKVCGSFYATLGAHAGWKIRDSDWNGKFRQTAAPGEVVNSCIPGLTPPTGQAAQVAPAPPAAAVENGGDAKDEDAAEEKDTAVPASLRPQPPQPDLTAIWPQ